MIKSLLDLGPYMSLGDPLLQSLAHSAALLGPSAAQGGLSPHPPGLRVRGQGEFSSQAHPDPTRASPSAPGSLLTAQPLPLMASCPQPFSLPPPQDAGWGLTLLPVR